ncbi:alpha/beta hydrolase [Ramlibacter ginsenosidimutans]|uniref:Alpha/beta hydrolase n=1 Tax=Ramlibacter ginsenosidimutans TaxID=502333 RepID=A0A934TX14_9BURK|nr:alpha/beta hydrolase [Ramlibacter ginsenosidimutans]MBK6008940.1 alpha/beta hydrolase [Ramlibacter ginsenosidimutans]
MPELQLAVIDVKPGAAMESQSGLQLMRPRIYGAWMQPAGPRRAAAIVMHPTSNFMGHYLIAPLAARGVACMGLNSRYAGNDTLLLMERVIQDLGAGVHFLRAQGYERIVLIGNSGGASLAAFYQAQAERLDIEHMVDGDPAALSPQDLPPVQGLALCAAHEGRSTLMRNWIDPSLTDEHDGLSRDPALDIYDARNAPPYGRAFLEHFRNAQQQRYERIEQWVEQRLALLRSQAAPGSPRDEVFVVYRTHADPRFLDLAIDANDRAVGSVWGAGAAGARAVNYAASQMGRITSLTAWLSQWSPRSRADGPRNLARTSVPVLLCTYTGDQSTFPSTQAAWLAAGGGRIRNVDVPGGNHYLAGQPQLVEQVADAMADWILAL